MKIEVIEHQDSTSERPRWFAIGERRGVRVSTATYASPQSASSAAISALMKLVAAGVGGDFVVGDDGSCKRRKHV